VSGVFVCGHILRKERHVRLAVHHRDGMWQLTCGEDDHPSDRAELYLIHPEHLLEREPELADTLHDLPRGCLMAMVDGIWRQYGHDD